MNSNILGIILSLLFNVILGNAPDLSRCPNNLSRDQYLRTYGNQCFQFKINDKNHFSKAKDYCANTGGQLLTVKDQFKEAFVVGALSSFNFHGDIWLGLTDKEKEGEYRWITGEVSTYSHWSPGEPTPFLSGIEDCVILSMPGGQWHDKGCDLPFDNFAWVCEYELQNPPTTQAPRIITSLPTSAVTQKPTTTLRPATTHEPTTTRKPTTRPMPVTTLKLTTKTTPMVTDRTVTPAKTNMVTKNQIIG